MQRLLRLNRGLPWGACLRFKFRLAPAGSASPGATILEKCIRLDNVDFIGTENIIGSNRWREGFSDLETRKLFLFENRYICIPCCQQITAVLPAGPPPTISSYTSRLSAFTSDSLRRVGRLQRPRRRAPLMPTTAAMGASVANSR